MNTGGAIGHITFKAKNEPGSQELGKLGGLFCYDSYT